MGIQVTVAALFKLEQERDQLKADNEALRKAVNFAAETFGTITSSDGSGHADLSQTVLRIAGNAIAGDAELRKDAERYRWLRDSSESIHQFYLSTPIWFTGVKFSKANVDSTIDAAMSNGEQS